MENLYKVVKVIFNLCLSAFLILGIVIVLVQFVAVVTQNGELAIMISDKLQLTAIRFSIVAAFTSFVANIIGTKKIKDK